MSRRVLQSDRQLAIDALAKLPVPACGDFVVPRARAIETSVYAGDWTDKAMGNIVLKQRSLAEDCDAMVGESRWTRERMLSAMRALDQALAKPTPNREPAWRRYVLEALGSLENAMLRQAAELADEDNTLAAIAREQPRLLSRIQQLREQYGDLVRQIQSLHEQLSAVDAPPTGEIRQRLAWMLTALRHFQSKETDLIFEATAVDIGAAD